MNKHPDTPFRRFLGSLGDELAAELLSRKVRTVQSWRLGERLPRPNEAREIAAKAGISLDDIYGEGLTE
jgi:hypothetical protein